MRKRTKNTIATLILIIISITALVMIRSYIFHSVRSKVQQKLEALNKGEFHVQYDSIYIDWRKNIIVIDNLNLKKDAYDTTCIYPEFISAGQVRIEGFRLLKFVFKSNLSFESVHIQDPHIVLREHSNMFLDSASRRDNEFTISIDHILLSSAHLEFTDSASCKLITDFKSDISASTVDLGFHVGQPFLFKVGNLRFDSTNINLPQAYYDLNIRSARIDFVKGQLDLDTMKIIPQFSKIAFGRKKGFETDRFEGVIPFMKLSGFSLEYPDTVSLKAINAEMQIFLKVFRDKRLIHLKKFKPLPLKQLSKLPFGLKIDTLQITKSFIEYEEFLENANEPGKVFFDDLTAFVYNINNDPVETDGETTLRAHALLMGQGDLKVSTVFPWKSGQKCVTEGSLENFSITKMNSVLESAANMKAESGDLNSLTFKFAYNSIRSEGELELNYHNLKLTSYKSDEKLEKQAKRKKGKKGKETDDPVKDNFKTFIINAFVIRKNMDENLPEDKRTGTILFYRDTSRSIFNYWWKSLLSGIKSAYNLDKPKDKKKNKKHHKEKA